MQHIAAPHGRWTVKNGLALMVDCSNISDLMWYLPHSFSLGIVQLHLSAWYYIYAPRYIRETRGHCTAAMARTKLSTYVAPHSTVDSSNGGLKPNKVCGNILQPAHGEILQQGFVLHISKQHKSELKEYITTVHRLDAAYERLARKWTSYDVDKRVRKIESLMLPPSVLRCCASVSTCVCNQEKFQRFLQRVCKRKTLAAAVYHIFLKRGHARMYARMECVCL